MTKYSELTREQQAELRALGYGSEFKEIAEEEVPALMERLAKQKDVSGLLSLTVQLQNLFIMKLWAEKQKNAKLIGVIGEAYQWAEKTHKDFDLEPEDCLVTLYETLKKSDQAGKWLQGTELITDEEGVYIWEIA